MSYYPGGCPFDKSDYPPMPPVKPPRKEGTMSYYQKCPACEGCGKITRAYDRNEHPDYQKK